MLSDDTPNAPELPGDFVAARDIIKSLIETRKLLKERLKDKTIEAALNEILRTASSGATAKGRLEATALLGKASETSRSVAMAIKTPLEKCMTNPLPPIGNWGSADDRYYLAKAISVSNASWIPQYAARELAYADIAEKTSRVVWAELAVMRAPTLADTLRWVAVATAEQVRSVNYRAEFLYRKLIRI